MNKTDKAVTDSRTVAGKLAQAFVRELRESISFGDFVKVRKLNATPAYGDGVCASHDFIDSNMVMDAAFTKIVGREIDCESGSDCALWSKAWDIAKDQYLTEKD